MLPLFEFCFLEVPLGLIHQRLELIRQAADHLPPAQHEANNQEPGEEPELLVGEGGVLRRPIPEVLPAEDSLIEDVGLGQVGRVARPLVLAVVELSDPGCDLPDLPPPQPGLHQLLPVLLLELPQLRVDLEGLVEIRVVPIAAVIGKIAKPGELAIALVDEGPEELGDGDGALRHEREASDIGSLRGDEWGH